MSEKMPRLRGCRVAGAIDRAPDVHDNRPDWFADPRRRCSMARADWEMWTSSDRSVLATAAQLCLEECPLVAECRAWAITTGQQHYVFGGLNLATNKDRKVVEAAKPKAVKPAPKPAPARPARRLQRNDPDLQAQVMQLWLQDKPDSAIAAALGIHPSTAYDIRKEVLGLPSKFGPQGVRRRVPA
jgi:hypothetical protein